MFKKLSVVLALVGGAGQCFSTPPAAETIRANPVAETEGTVSLGDLRRVNPTPEAASATGVSGGIPLIGGAQAVQPGQAAKVYSTMQAAANDGVNPLGKQAAPASAPLLTSTKLNVVDTSLLGRLSALPATFLLGALLLVGVLGFAVYDWKRR